MNHSKITYIYVSPSGKTILFNSLEEALGSLRENGYLWIDLCDPDKKDLDPLIAPFGLHPLSIEDSTNGGQIPKIESFPNYSFIIFNEYDMLDDDLQLNEIDLIVGTNFLISISSQSEVSQSLHHRLEKIIDLGLLNVGQGPAFLAYLILDLVVDQKLAPIESIEDNLELDEDLILSDFSKFNPSSLMNKRRMLIALRKSVYHELEIVNRIMRRDSPFFPDKTLVFFRDIYDHLTKYSEMIESSRELTPTLMEMYLSMLNNQMTRASNQTNAIMRRLTLITTIFMPLTLLSGIGGMSEYTMMTQKWGWPLAYLILLVVFIIIALINFILLKRLEKNSGKLIE